MIGSSIACLEIAVPRWGVSVTLAVVGSASFGADCEDKARRMQAQLSSDQFQFEVLPFLFFFSWLALLFSIEI